MRRFGFKNIMHIVYGLVILLPMFSILGRVIYTQSNLNAKDSYSDNYVEKTISLTNGNRSTIYVQNAIFTYIDTGLTYGVQSNILGFSEINLDLNSLLGTTDVSYVAFRFYTSSSKFMYFYDANSTQYTLQNFRDLFTQFTYTVDLTTYNNLPTADTYGTWLTYTYVNQPLDNAFEYSISEFTKDNNLGNVDMFSWFTNLFLNQDNPKNALYVGFTNWYLNYVLLVSSGYLFFLVLIFFVNYSRKILEKSMYQDYGGF